MALQPLWTGSQLLHKLLADYLDRRIDTETFCRDFISSYNFKIELKDLTTVEQKVFSRLFDAAGYYSPFPRERAAIPNYRSEEQIYEAAREANAALSSSS